MALRLGRWSKGPADLARSAGDETLLLGAFHLLNLGDLALGQAIAARLHGAIDKAVIQDKIRYSGQSAVVIGGGSLLTPDNIGRMRSAGIPADCVSAIGVDLWPRILTDWTFRDLDYLRGFRRVSLRSQANFELVAQLGIIELKRLTWSYDNAFSLFDDMEAAPVQGVIGVNMMPHLFTLRNREFEVGSRLARKRFGDGADEAAEAYVALFRSLVTRQVKEGRLVVHVPFAPEDDLFARVALAGLPVRFSSYTPSVPAMINMLSRLELFFGTRYHAFVFALGLGLPFAGVAYAGKCENLMRDVWIPEHAVLTDADLMSGQAWQDRIELAQEKPFRLAHETRCNLISLVGEHLNHIAQKLTSETEMSRR
jgi:polysaccharide pyruvyl transferase WcaK-like protein